MVLTEFSPGDEASGAVSHVEGIRSIRQSLCGDDAKHGGDSTL